MAASVHMYHSLLIQAVFLAIGLNLVKRDFADHDLAMFDFLRPHLIQAYGNASMVSVMQDQLAAMQRTSEELDRAILSVSHTGRIRWATPRVVQLLVDYGLQRTRRSDWLPSPLREAQGSLRIRFVPDDKQQLLLLEELRPQLSIGDLRSLGLSRRKTETLSWVLQGKTNIEIGKILGISSRTVKKHLESVYTRLDVENRHASMSLVLGMIRKI